MAKATILIIEDETDIREALSVSFQEMGYEVVTAVTGKVAVEKANQSPPDLILLDIMLPDMDGYEVCARLREGEETRKTPIIFVSAIGSEKHMQKAMDAGGTDYIIKPFGRDDLQRLAERYLSYSEEE